MPSQKSTIAAQNISRFADFHNVPTISAVQLNSNDEFQLCMQQTAPQSSSGQNYIN